MGYPFAVHTTTYATKSSKLSKNKFNSMRQITHSKSDTDMGFIALYCHYICLTTHFFVAFRLCIGDYSFT